METAGKIVDDEELKEALKEKGVGTLLHALNYRGPYQSGIRRT